MTASSVVGTRPPLLPPGEYVAVLKGWDTSNSGADRRKLRLRLEVEVDAWARAELSRHYNVAEVVGRPGEGGSFRISAFGDAYRELFVSLGDAFAASNIDLRSLLHQSLLVEVASVTRDSKRQPVPAGLQYSKVARLIGRVVAPPPQLEKEAKHYL